MMRPFWIRRFAEESAACGIGCGLGRLGGVGIGREQIANSQHAATNNKSFQIAHDSHAGYQSRSHPTNLLFTGNWPGQEKKFIPRMGGDGRGLVEQRE
jgi:hypothetical protein